MSGWRAQRLRGAGGLGLHALVGDAAGRGVPFLLVHGLASNARMWLGVGDELQRLGHAVAAVDLRGHGRSDKPPSGYGYAEVAADLVAVLDELAWDRPVAVGQSWGGNVVLELAARHPRSVRGVGGVDGGMIDLRASFPTWEACAGALAPPVLAGTPLTVIEQRLRATHPDWPESGIAGALACFDTDGDGRVRPWLPRPHHMEILRAMWGRRPGEIYGKVQVPTLLVPARTAGRGDGLAWEVGKDAQVAEAERQLCSCRVHWMEGDHDLHAQHPRAVAALLHGCVEDGFWP